MFVGLVEEAAGRRSYGDFLIERAPIHSAKIPRPANSER